MRVNAPKGVLTESLRAQIAERKAELLEFLRDYYQSAASIPPPILRRPAGNPVPLSFAQERLWFLEQLEPGGAVYNICRASRLTGKLNFAVLEASLNEIVRRHEVLRLVIRVADGRPVQVAEPPHRLKLSVVDLQVMSDAEREPEIRQRIQQAAETPFDFSAGKFLRAELLRLGDDKHILILTTHHIVSDAWSMGILTRELWSLYEAYAARELSRLEELAVQYADFAIWQRDWMQGEVLESQLSYWKRQLEDLPVLNLPTDRTRPSRQSFHGARVPITLAEPLSEAINDLSTQCGVTPFMTLLAAFQVLLYRYSGQDDVVVGSPVANRRASELEALIGFFVNTLVLRGDLSGEPSFKELLARFREVCLGAYAHQDLPFEKLVVELNPERDPSRNPLFQVMFVLQNATRPFSGIPGLRIEPIEIESTRSPFDLSLFLRERDGKYIGYIEYSTDLFDAATIERMAGHFSSLLEGIVADPNRRTSELPILTQAERHQLLVEWNDTAADYPKDKCIHELFEEQVERTPDAIAVTFNGRQLTYRELNTRANQLAHYLRGLGVGPEKLVGICVERSLEMVVGLLGILKAGGAYVPLDPAYPRERLQFMLNDAQCSVLLAQEKYLRNGPLSAVSRRPTYVCLDREWPIIEQKGEENPKGDVSYNNLAYVIYTSGSTGIPKGVAIEHRNASNLLHWARNIYAPEQLKGVLASTSISFDLSVFELFVPLSWGGKVVLVENVLCLLESPSANEVTLINTVPSAMTALLSAGRLPGTVRVVNLAGEPLDPELVRQVYDSGPVEKVYDLYAPSETTTYSTSALRTAGGSETIGRPISNTQVYVLDSELQPVPVNVTGELYIGGAGVARRYLDRPELTSEKFLSNPFSYPGDRLYRTGDLARYLPDGQLHFLGRNDDQVKIRGYRIELGEVEAALNQHPAVQDSIVVARARDSLNEESLVGYVVQTRQSLSMAPQLRDYLREKLPDYMIPSVFVILDALPLTPSGKINRNALPTPDSDARELMKEFTGPRTEIEELVAQTWRRVLKLERIEIDDNFFDLGGHSLLALQIVARLRDVFNCEIPLSVMFEAPTIIGLARRMEHQIREGPLLEKPPLMRVSHEEPLPLSMNQEHLWYLDQMIPGTHFFNMPYVYRLRGDLVIEAVDQALQEIIRRHEALRTVFVKKDRYPVQLIKKDPNFQHSVLDLRRLASSDAAQKAAALIIEEREAPFDLKVGPLLRTKLVRLTDDECLLMVTVHHIISDYWSMQIFRREFIALYECFSQGCSSPLSQLPFQFADFVSWERKALKTGYFNGQLDYWKKQLVRQDSAFRIPGRTVGDTRTSFQTLRSPFGLDNTLFAKTIELARRENSTTFVVLLAALNVAIYLFTGEQNVRIGTLVANRARPQSEGVIGHFMNTIILCTSVHHQMTFRQHLHRVRHAFLSAYTQQELPFEQLARILHTEHGVARESLFKLLISYQRVTSQSNSLGLTITSWNIESLDIGTELTPTTYDLIFALKDLSTKLTGTVNYKTNIFTNYNAITIIDLFKKAIEKMLTGLDDRIISISRIRV